MTIRAQCAMYNSAMASARRLPFVRQKQRALYSTTARRFGRPTPDPLVFHEHDPALRRGIPDPRRVLDRLVLRHAVMLSQGDQRYTCRAKQAGNDYPAETSSDEDERLGGHTVGSGGDQPGRHTNRVLKSIFGDAVLGRHGRE
jgi:hypothetical protein